ncbi:MAG: protein disulfide oxidoreductase [Halanaerobiales bacterium]
MPKISNEEQDKIKDMFQEKLAGEVNILFFSEDSGCEYCDDTAEILDEIAELDDRIKLEKGVMGDDKAEKYNIEMTPATLFVDDEGNDTGVRFYGIPSGYEFNTLIEDIIDVSRKKPDLPDDALEQIKEIDEDVRLQVFITPTCPYCPRAVRVAHQMAMVNSRISGEMVEAIEFPDLSDKYNVSGVPKTVINDGAAEQEGAVPLKAVISKVKSVI